VRGRAAASSGALDWQTIRHLGSCNHKPLYSARLPLLPFAFPVPPLRCFNNACLPLLVSNLWPSVRAFNTKRRATEHRAEARATPHGSLCGAQREAALAAPVDMSFLSVPTASGVRRLAGAVGAHRPLRDTLAQLLASSVDEWPASAME
jgi:hypothetical protein